MSGLCGWFRPRGREPSPSERIAAMAAPLTRFDGAPLRTAATSFGGVATAAPDRHADLYRDGAWIAAIWGRPRFTDTALSARARDRGIAETLVHAYARRKTDVLAALSGSFALVLLNSADDEALLAVDRMGTRPLCYSSTAQALVFGTTLDAICAYAGARPGIDPQAIYDYLHFHMVPAPLTVHARHRRLLPGHFLLWRNGSAREERYWRLRFVENERRSFAELKYAFTSTLRESIREAASDGAVGSFLSGGTDSSTLAGMLCEVTGRAAPTYSIGFDVEGYDEMAYARIAARHFGTRHHEYYVTADDVVAAIPRIAAVHDQPYGNASAVPTYYCAKLAREDGTRTLLGGDGGDELFGGNDRYARQYLYSLYGDLPSGIRAGLIEPIVFLAPPVGVLGKVQRYMRNASQPMPARYDNHNLLERLGPQNVFTADFLSAVDVRRPQALLADAYGESESSSLINRMLALDARFTLADNDLPKVMRSCELAQIEALFPMLDDSLVDFAARLSPDDKLKGTRLRYFFKKALDDYLPPEILRKKKHGFGLPFGVWLDRHRGLRDAVLDSLGDLKRRRIIRDQFVDELLAIRTREHAAYYGTMVWLLVMLEQWFARDRVPAAHVATTMC